jgi:hypothetical protein
MVTNALEAVGIISGLFFTGLSYWSNAKTQRVANLLDITKQHRDLWTNLFSNPELERVLNPSADVEKQPMTAAEELFVNLVVTHLATAHRTGHAQLVATPEKLREDIASFFSMPIPHAAWKNLKNFQDVSFIAFIEEHLND